MGERQSETLYDFYDAEGAAVGIGTKAEAEHWIAEGVLPADLQLVLVGEVAL